MARTRDETRFAAKREAILRAAEACFLEKGFHGAGMAEICKAAGMSPGALYRYFPSKEAIIEGIADEERDETAGLFAAIEAADDIVAELVSALTEVMTAVSDPDYGRIALEIAAEAGRNPAVAAPFRRNEALAAERLRAVIAAGQKKGQIDASLDPGDAARLMLMLVDGATGRQAIDKDFDARALATSLEAMIGGFLVGGTE